VCAAGSTASSILGPLPLPLWGEGWGEGGYRTSRDRNPSPHPSPSRSRIHPTSADLKCRTRVNPSSVGEGAHRACRSFTGSKQKARLEVRRASRSELDAAVTGSRCT
jgi:hypothetical protein